MAGENLWPDFEPGTIPNPKKIMQEQANFFKDKTKGKLYAQIAQGTSPDGINLSFQIVAPFLGNYKYALFHVIHDIDGYPLAFMYQDRTDRIENPDDLKGKMKELFNSPDTIQKISTLLSYE